MRRQPERAGPPAPAEAGARLDGRRALAPLPPTSGPPWELTNQPGTYFFLAVIAHTTHKTNQRASFVPVESSLGPFSGSGSRQ